jgi:ubiquitin C-terminal hydrolase
LQLHEELNKSKNNNNINDNNYDTNEENLLDYIDPDKKHLRGLVNIASTCYMNSILQCFINIKELAVYFQSEKITNLSLIYKDDNQKLFPAFQEVIKELWDPIAKSPYSPYNFKKRLGQMNPLFQGALPNDAKDLLTFILLQLHEELNKSKNNNNINNVNYMNMQNDQKSMFKSFCKYFADNNRSIISGLFYGIFYNITQCINGHIFYNYQTFNFIIFPLDKVLKYKIQSNNFISNFNNTVTIEDCFKYYEYPTILNDYYCNICNKQCNCNYISKFSIMPNIIIIILNRGRGLEHKVNISFQNENLGLNKFVEYFKEDSVYELIGLVTHYGDSSASGHFMARCKSPIDDEWYLYNDSIVQKIGYFNNETFAQGNPYILFYKKINFQK